MWETDTGTETETERETERERERETTYKYYTEAQYTVLQVYTLYDFSNNPALFGWQFGCGVVVSSESPLLHVHCVVGIISCGLLITGCDGNCLLLEY